MQLCRNQLASSQPLTILGGFIGSMIFISLLTVLQKLKYNFSNLEKYCYFRFFLKALSNFEMNTFGPNYQARIFPEG